MTTCLKNLEPDYEKDHENDDARVGIAELGEVDGLFELSFLIYGQSDEKQNDWEQELGQYLHL